MQDYIGAQRFDGPEIDRLLSVFLRGVLKTDSGFPSL